MVSDSMLSWRSVRTAVRQDPQDRIQYHIEPSAYVFGKNSQDEVPLFLQQRVFAAVAPVGVRVGQMLTAIQSRSSCSSRPLFDGLHKTEPDTLRLGASDGADYVGHGEAPKE